MLTKLPKNRNLGFESLYKRWISSSYEAQKPRRVAAVWGNGDYGRLGLGSLESQWRPVNISSFGDQSVCQIACGGAHTLFLTGCGFIVVSEFLGFCVSVIYEFDVCGCLIYYGIGT